MYLLQCSDKRHELQLFICSVRKNIMIENFWVIDDSVALGSVLFYWDMAVVKQ